MKITAWKLDITRTHHTEPLYEEFVLSDGARVSIPIGEVDVYHTQGEIDGTIEITGLEIEYALAMRTLDLSELECDGEKPPPIVVRIFSADVYDDRIVFGVSGEMAYGTKEYRYERRAFPQLPRTREAIKDG